MNESDQAFLVTADFLGAKLCRDAIWAGNRCNWVGPATIDLRGGRQSAGHKACGPDLFSGTAGIAIFLARLFAATGEKIFILTAEGAIRQALSRLDDFPPAIRIGFYTGLTGVAYVLAELAELLSVDKFTAMAQLILEEVGKDDPEQHDLDVMSGSAGAIPVLLKIHRKQPQDFLLETAFRHGERLLTAASTNDSRWTSARTGFAHPQIGFAHGIDGIAWALMELSHFTGREGFRHAAEQCLRYQQSGFENEEEDRSKVSGAAAESASWLRGASGVGMTRFRAFELLGDEIYLNQGKAALRTTLETLSESSSEAEQSDFSLAQGLTGSAELLLYARHTLKDESLDATAKKIGAQGIQRCADLQWPCGAPGGAETPNLMLGLAGIGYFYLRLYDPIHTPSLLMVIP